MTEYKTSKGLEQAVLEAARRSGRPIQKVQEEFWRNRLLARIFHEQDSSFVLKGGTSMLARIPNARRTRDIDIATDEEDSDFAINEIVALSKTDLHDFCRFDLLSVKPIQEEAVYRRGARLKFSLHIGTKSAPPVSVDLVFGCSPTAPIERIKPRNIEGFPFSELEYPLYPLVDHAADKVCAIMETHRGGQPSSRVKDLVDLCVIACNETLGLKSFGAALFSESKIRKIYPLEEFSVPEEWNDNKMIYRNIAKEVVLDDRYHDQEVAINLVKLFVNPALANSVPNLNWNPTAKIWK